VALAIAACAATVRVSRMRPLIAAVTLLLPALAGVGFMPAWSPQRLSSGLFRERHASREPTAGQDAVFALRANRVLRFYDDDPTMSVAVFEYPRQDRRIDRSIFTNGKSDGSSVHDYTTMGLAALLPALLAERAERAFVIGYGTGVTAGEFAALESAREVIVAEISRGVIDAAPLFDYANLGASRHPNVRIIPSDARRSLVRRYAARHGGRLPPQARAQIVEETCFHRPNECLTLLAQWEHEAPEAPRLREIEQELIARQLRVDPGAKRRVVLRSRVRALSLLYGGLAESVDGQDVLAAARQASSQFAEFYHHAAPFSRRALAELWDRCEATPAQREACRSARDEVEEVLGELRFDLGRRRRSG
jgi:hypothetical protein